MFMFAFVSKDLLKSHHFDESKSDLIRSLQFLPPADRLLLIPMEENYTAASLAKKGINSLANFDRAHFEAIKAATGNRWKIRIIAAELERYFQVGDNGKIHNASAGASVLKIYNEEGNDLTSEDGWLREDVDFDPFEDSVDRMVVADPDHGIRDIWGTRFHQSTTESLYGPATTKQLFKASFILVSFSQVFSFAHIVLFYC